MGPYLILVIRPGAEAEATFLLVKWEIRDVNVARTLEGRRGFPADATLV